MTYIKRILFLFVIVKIVFSIATGKELNNPEFIEKEILQSTDSGKAEEKPQDFCEDVCGKDPGVKCDGDQTIREKIICNCKVGTKVFDITSKTCKEKPQFFCEDVCGKDPGVKCDGDKTIRENIICNCKDGTKVFDIISKTCKEKPQNFCEVVCGKDPGVKCDGDKTIREHIICNCKDGTKVFDITSKICKDKCKGFQCKNGGTCEIRNENPVCKCPDLFTGDQCQIEIDGCILKRIYNECNKPNEICEHGKCRCKENYKYSHDNESCEGKEMCKDKNVIEECRSQFALCKKHPFGKDMCVCDKGYTMTYKNGSSECKDKCYDKRHDCKYGKYGDCELNEDHNAECICPALLTRKDKSSSCKEIAKFSYLGEISFLKSKYFVENEMSDLQQGPKYIVSFPSLKRDLKEAVQYVYGYNFKDVKIIKPSSCNEDENLLTCVIELQLKKQPKAVNALLSSSYCYALPKGFCFVKNLVMKRVKSLDLFKLTDPCVLKNIFCGFSTNCESSITERTIKCTCKKGFSRIRSYNPVINKGNLVELCIDIDECSTNTHSCPENTTCLNTYGSYECFCKDGFKSKDGEFDAKKHGCEEIDKCSTNSCPENTFCLNTFQGYECPCEAGFISKTGDFDAKIHGCETIFKSSGIKYNYIFITGGVLGASFIVILVVVLTFNKIRKSRTDRLNEQRQNVASAGVIHVQRN